MVEVERDRWVLDSPFLNGAEADWVEVAVSLAVTLDKTSGAQIFNKALPTSWLQLPWIQEPNSLAALAS